MNITYNPIPFDATTVGTDVGFTSSGTAPRKGWRTPLDKNRYSEQRDAETRLSYCVQHRSLCRFDSSGTDPRKGWRIPLNEIKYNEQRDAETGLSYFGARYYDSELLTGWLSIDPMADKYPSISPYAYCAWNPVKLVDPDGEDVWDLSADGTMSWVKKSSHDVIRCNGKKITLQNSNNVFGPGSKGSSFSLNDNQYYTFTDVMDAQKAFEFFADNLNFEFSALGYIEDGKKQYDLTTSLSEVGDANGSKRAVELGDKLLKHFHNHPNGIISPSDPTNRKGNGDDKTFYDNIKQKSPLCEFFLYAKVGGGGYVKYDFEEGQTKVTDKRQSSFEKNNNYARKPNYLIHAFGL